MAIWPFIISRLGRTELGEKVIRHEKIHFRQQLELLILPFFLWYTIEYFYHLLVSKNKHLAYRSISFEKEAYANDHNESYLQERKLFSWISYLKKNATEDPTEL